MFGGNIYGAAERRKKIYLVALAITVLAALVFAWKAIPRSPISTSWDTSSIKPGDSAILRVTVTNNTDKVVENVIVYVEPVSKFLRVYSQQSLDNNTADPSIFIIPSLAPGDHAVATYLVTASRTAYAGDHSVIVSVAMPGATYQRFAKIRVM